MMQDTSFINDFFRQINTNIFDLYWNGQFRKFCFIYFITQSIRENDIVFDAVFYSKDEILKKKLTLLDFLIVYLKYDRDYRVKYKVLYQKKEPIDNLVALQKRQQSIKRNRKMLKLLSNELKDKGDQYLTMLTQLEKINLVMGWMRKHHIFLKKQHQILLIIASFFNELSIIRNSDCVMGNKFIDDYAKKKISYKNQKLCNLVLLDNVISMIKKNMSLKDNQLNDYKIATNYQILWALICEKAEHANVSNFNFEVSFPATDNKDIRIPATFKLFKEKKYGVLGFQIASVAETRKWGDCDSRPEPIGRIHQCDIYGIIFRFCEISLLNVRVIFFRDTSEKKLEDHANQTNKDLNLADLKIKSTRPRYDFYEHSDIKTPTLDIYMNNDSSLKSCQIMLYYLSRLNFPQITFRKNYLSFINDFLHDKEKTLTNGLVSTFFRENVSSKTIDKTSTNKISHLICKFAD